MGHPNKNAVISYREAARMQIMQLPPLWTFAGGGRESGTTKWPQEPCQ